MPANDDLQVTDERPAEVRAISPVYLQSTRALPGLSDRELVDELLRFANTGGGVARSLLESGARWASDAHLEELRGERLFSRDWLELEAEQLEVREALAKIAARGVAAPLLALWRRRAAGLVLLPTFEPDGTRRYRHAPFERFASGVQPPLAYALLLCGAFRDQLCRCGWEQCGQFFMAAKPKGGKGAPIREYCPGTDHRERAHQADAPERMRRSRERARQRARVKQSKRRRS